MSPCSHPKFPEVVVKWCKASFELMLSAKLYIPSTLNIDFILWHTQLNVCAENVKSWVFYFTFQAYTLPHGLRTPSEEIAFTARPKIHSHSQILRCGRSIFCLPQWPKFSDIFDLCLHWVSVVRALPHTINCICVSLFKFHIWTLKQFYHCPKQPALSRHIKVWVSFELFWALYMYIFGYLLLLSTFSCSLAPTIPPMK